MKPSASEVNDLYIQAYTLQISFEEFLEKFNQLVNLEFIGENPVEFISEYPESRLERLMLKTAEESQDLVLEYITETDLSSLGDGCDYSIIYRVIPYDRYIVQKGDYYSYSGVSAHTHMYEVKPQMVQSIEYVAV
jgi:hypothetical protein